MTEWPLTEVATCFVLMLRSPKILLIALETLPESTIMESTTMSLASGSTPRCDTWISPFERFSSIALIELEPMSKPTIDFAEPNPNMPSCLPFVFLKFFPREKSAPCRRPRRFRFLLGAAHVHGALLLHPLVQNGFLEFPAVPEFERRDLFLGYVFVQRVRADPQLLRSLADVYYLTRIYCHKRVAFPQWVVGPNLGACGDVFLLYVFSGGKLQVRASYNWVNIRRSSRNFRYLPVSSGFYGGSWYFRAQAIPKCCVHPSVPPQLLVVLLQTVHYFA